MSVPHKRRRLFRKEVSAYMRYIKEELLTFRRPEKDDWAQIIAPMAGMAFCLLFGYFIGKVSLGGLMTLGLFVFFYYEQMPLRLLLKRLVLVGLLLLFVMFVSLLCWHFQWTAPMVIGSLAFLCRLFFRLYGMQKPGALFVILLSAVGVGIESNFQSMVGIMGAMSLGVTLGIILAVVVHFTERNSSDYQIDKSNLKERINRDPGALMDALFYAGTLFFAVYLSMGIGLDKPSWMIFSCAGILQVKNIRAMMNRNIQRISGTVLGLIVASMITAFPMSQLMQIFIVVALYGTLQYCMRVNYALGIFVSTPMAILLTTMISNKLTVTSAISNRLIGIVLGCILGVTAAWVMVTTLKFYNRKWDLDLEKSEENENQ